MIVVANVNAHPTWSRVAADVARRYIARELAPTKSSILRQMAQPSLWQRSGFISFFDVPLRGNMTRYGLVEDSGDWYATVRMEKGRGGGGRRFINPDGTDIRQTDLATVYSSKDEALEAVLVHAADALTKWKLPEEEDIPDESLWTRWFGRKAELSE